MTRWLLAIGLVLTAVGLGGLGSAWQPAAQRLSAIIAIMPA